MEIKTNLRDMPELTIKSKDPYRFRTELTDTKTDLSIISKQSLQIWKLRLGP